MCFNTGLTLFWNFSKIVTMKMCSYCSCKIVKVGYPTTSLLKAVLREGQNLQRGCTHPHLHFGVHNVLDKSKTFLSLSDLTKKSTSAGFLISNKKYIQTSHLRLYIYHFHCVFFLFFYFFEEGPRELQRQT